MLIKINPGLCENGTTYNGMSDDNWTECPNVTSTLLTLPSEMTFNEGNLISVIAYTCIFIVSAIGNLTVFITLFRNRQRKSRVNLFIMHLSVADLIVTFVMVPLETGWHITVQWIAGDPGCRILMFFRAFGFYLSSFLLVTISIDRYFAIVHPLSWSKADSRGKVMLGLSWMFSAVASTPQSIIFHVENHPVYTGYTQCVTFNFFPSPAHEMFYNVFNLLTVYGIPLLVILVSYTRIVCEIYKKTRERREATFLHSPRTGKKIERLRRSATGNIEKTRIRTLKMTVTIVLVFVVCWTPYYVMNIWFWIDRESAMKVDNKVQRGLFLFAVSNALMDPIVYGMFTIDFKRELKHCCHPHENQTYQRSTSPTTRSVLLRQSSSSSSFYAQLSVGSRDCLTMNTDHLKLSVPQMYELQVLNRGTSPSPSLRRVDLAKRSPPYSPSETRKTPRHSINSFKLP